MALNCTQIDDVHELVSEFATQTSAGALVATGALALVSLALLTHGERLVRPLGGALGGLAGAVLAFVFSAAAGLPCEVRVAAAAIAGVLLAVVALCLLKTGLFLLGASGMGVLGHLAYSSVPFDDSDAPFRLFGMSGWYFVTVGGSAVVGGIVSQVQKKHFVRTVSSALGGSGLAVCTHVLLVHFGADELSPLGPLIVAVGGTAAGCLIQNRLERRRKQRRESRKGDGK